MARPSKLSPEVEARLIEAIDVGMTYTLSAHYAGISPTTLDNWRRQGERLPNSEHGEFLTRLKAAEARAAFNWLRKMDSLPQGWQAMAWKLERRHPDDYAKKDAEEALKVLRLLVGNAGNPV